MRIMLRDIFNQWKVVYENRSSKQHTEEAYNKSIDALHKEMMKMGYYPPNCEYKYDEKSNKEYIYDQGILIGFVDFEWGDYEEYEDTK